jgi:hypothetical protein
MRRKKRQDKAPLHAAQMLDKSRLSRLESWIGRDGALLAPRAAE